MNKNRKIRFSKFYWIDKNKIKFLLCALIIGLSVVNSYPISSDIRPSHSSKSVLLKDANISDRELLEAPFVYAFDSSIQKLITSKVKDVFARHMNSQYKNGSNWGKANFVIPDGRLSLRKKIFSEELNINVSDEEYELLIKHEFNECIPKLINLIISKVLSEGVILDKKLFLQELSRGILIKCCSNHSTRQIENIRTVCDFDQTKERVTIIANSFQQKLDPDLINLIVNLSHRLIKPNIIFSVEETNKRKDSIVKLVIPEPNRTGLGEFFSFDENEVATREANNTLLRMLGQVLILVVILLIYYEVQIKPKMKSKQLCNKDLIFLTAILLITMATAKVSAVFPDMLDMLCPDPSVLEHNYNTRFALPVVTGSMIVCLVLGTEAAFSFLLLFSVIVSITLLNKFEHCIYFFLSAVMAIWWVKDCRERGTIIKAGTKLGLFCVFMSAMTNIYTVQSLNWVFFLSDSLIAFASGVSAGMIVIGALPLVEMLFKYTTNSTLLELANLDRPILRRLVLEAPGTYHHSIVVGSMVEAAASEIGANPLLSKVCGYYHDIGKLRQPLYFVENQLDHRNRHDKLSPSMSSLVIISHVKYGIEMAKKHNLGNAIIDVIRQHHGNSSIRYFLDKAKQLKGEENVNVSDFRYPGPLPQTVEAGLVMLADVVEAASRTLVNPTSSRIKGLVHNLINKVFSDGQLSDCNLTLRDLNSIAKSFNNILSGIYHNRVEYKSSSGVVTDGNFRNVDTGQKQSSASGAGSKGSKNSSNSLKRLGLS